MGSAYALLKSATALDAAAVRLGASGAAGTASSAAGAGGLGAAFGLGGIVAGTGAAAAFSAYATSQELPKVLALNFVLSQALGGGGPRSLRSDNLGKTLGGALLRMTVDVPDAEVAPRRPRPDLHLWQGAR